jgi:hypothetical protein
VIQNLNFYDIYGYLIPGLTLAMLLWLPHGVLTKQLPDADWGSALLAVVVGYVLGHLVQILGRNALPSETMDGRYPSEVLLDHDKQILSDELKTRLQQRIKSLSGIDVRTDLEAPLNDEVRTQRRDGFYFCRDALLTSKTISYGEQMQGMYTLMDGLTVAFALGAVYNFGWALSGRGDNLIQSYAWVLVLLGMLIAILVAFFGNEKKRKANAWWMLSSLAVALVAVGYTFGLGRVSNWNQRGRFGAIMLAAIFASFICFRAYKYFTRVYAETIYRAFNLYEKPDKAAAPAAIQSREVLAVLIK